MNTHRIRTSVLTGLAMVLGSTTAAVAGPQYASERTEAIITAMVEAHGGMETWAAAPAISFDNVMHNNYAGKESFAWWIIKETIEQGSRRVVQHWPMDDADIAYDGEHVWSHNYNRANPPEFGAHFFYYFVNLPWLTQDDNVILSEVSEFAWPGLDRSFHEIRMTFSEAPGIGKTERDYFVLYIDPQTHLLVGYQYAIGYKPMLAAVGQPPERELFGPLWRLITRYEEVDGLRFPAAFRTMPEPDERIVGNHVILNIDIRTPLDEARLKPPVTARYVAP